ncbi:hypothetical protein FQA47_008239 [Oryzias melastigma]|uniref:Uncharacterized protein n=1 Tax=Oryzias melastigma TaxID=30732 RepID=A0A834C5A2_ORYME|nr:hypothetical protein FQA47_008239 [Oryzias melastigma]
MKSQQKLLPQLWTVASQLCSPPTGSSVSEMTSVLDSHLLNKLRGPPAKVPLCHTVVPLSPSPTTYTVRWQPLSTVQTLQAVNVVFPCYSILGVMKHCLFPGNL